MYKISGVSVPRFQTTQRSPELKVLGLKRSAPAQELLGLTRWEGFGSAFQWEKNFLIRQEVRGPVLFLLRCSFIKLLTPTPVSSTTQGSEGPLCQAMQYLLFLSPESGCPVPTDTCSEGGLHEACS